MWRSPYFSAPFRDSAVSPRPNHPRPVVFGNEVNFAAFWRVNDPFNFEAVVGGIAGVHAQWGGGFIGATFELAKFFALFAGFEGGTFGQIDFADNATNGFLLKGLLGSVGGEPAGVVDNEADAVRVIAERGGGSFQEFEFWGSEELPHEPFGEGCDFTFEKVRGGVAECILVIPAAKFNALTRPSTRPSLDV